MPLRDIARTCSSLIISDRGALGPSVPSRRSESCWRSAASTRRPRRAVASTGAAIGSVASLAGKIGCARHLFTDPAEPFLPAADRNVLVASYIFDAARDEFDDQYGNERLHAAQAGLLHRIKRHPEADRLAPLDEVIGAIRVPGRRLCGARFLHQHMIVEHLHPVRLHQLCRDIGHRTVTDHLSEFRDALPVAIIVKETTALARFQVQKRRRAAQIVGQCHHRPAMQHAIAIGQLRRDRQFRLYPVGVGEDDPHPHQLRERRLRLCDLVVSHPRPRFACPDLPEQPQT